MTPTNADQIQFLEHHTPALTDGHYTVTQTITHDIVGASHFSPNVLYFYVTGERFALAPDLIFAHYPPRQAIGTFDNALPHIELNRSTLPWERKISTADESNSPWLALILFDETEFTKPDQVEMADSTLGDRTSAAVTTGPAEPFQAPTAWQYRDAVGLKHEPGEARVADREQVTKADEHNPRVTVLQVKKSLAQSLLPSAQDLRSLTHVRSACDREGTRQERASLICKRLPQPGKRSQVHLVSLEGRFQGDSFDYSKGVDGDKITLLSLFQWEFTCLAAEIEGHHGGTFPGLCANLDVGPILLDDPGVKAAASSLVANYFLEVGSAPLPHALRGGGKTVSWYRGPLLPVQMNLGDYTHSDFPVVSSDELIKFHETSDLLDVSLAAAWELGRLMTLSDPAMAANMQRWKLAHAQAVKHDEELLLHAHLPFMERSFGTEEDSTLSRTLSGYFEDLHLLKGVPFGYLVPDETYLPIESIRFFEVDPKWCEALMDGAFSIGRGSDLARDRERKTVTGQDAQEKPNAAKYPVMSGVLLRSELVAGWPAIQVDGFDVRLDDASSHMEKYLLGTISEGIDASVGELDNQNVPKVVVNTINRELSALYDLVRIEDRKMQTGELAKLKRDDVTCRSISDDLSLQPLRPSAWLLVDNANLEYFLIRKEGDDQDPVLNIYDEFQLPVLRFDRIGNDVLLVLFQGVAKTVDMHLPEESLHFGFEPGNAQVGFQKECKSLVSGGTLFTSVNNTKVPKTVSVLPTQEPYGLVDVGRLKTDLQEQIPDETDSDGVIVSATELTSGKLAVELIQGIPRARFWLGH